MNTARELIESLGLCIVLSEESNQCVNYIADYKNPNFRKILKITKKVFEFPTVGSNAFLGNYFFYQEPDKIYKKYRLQLCDNKVLEDDDIELRINEIKKILK